MTVRKKSNRSPAEVVLFYMRRKNNEIKETKRYHSDGQFEFKHPWNFGAVFFPYSFFFDLYLSSAGSFVQIYIYTEYSAV